MVQLKGYKVNKLEIENRVKNGTQLKIQNQLKYNVSYLTDNKTCVGRMELTMSDADMQPFKMTLEMIAEFTYEQDDEREEIHTNSFDQLFPFARQIVNTATSFTGIPGLILPIMKLNKDSVRRADSSETSLLN